MSTVLILGIIIIIIFIIYMKTDFFSSDENKDTKNSTETKNKKLKPGNVGYFITNIFPREIIYRIFHVW